MLDAVSELGDIGTPLEDALVGAGHRRLRPVLMTWVAAVRGMLPLAYGVGTAAAILQPVATAARVVQALGDLPIVIVGRDC